MCLMSAAERAGSRGALPSWFPRAASSEWIFPTRWCVERDNTMFIVGGVEGIPWEANFFDRAISVESAYYWPDPARGIKEIFRVLREGGSAWILLNYYRDNPHCHKWGEKLQVP